VRVITIDKKIMILPGPPVETVLRFAQSFRGQYILLAQAWRCASYDLWSSELHSVRKLSKILWRQRHTELFIAF